MKVKYLVSYLLTQLTIYRLYIRQIQATNLPSGEQPMTTVLSVAENLCNYDIKEELATSLLTSLYASLLTSLYASL